MRYIRFYNYIVIQIYYNYNLTLLFIQVAFIVECIIRKFHVVCVCVCVCACVCVCVYSGTCLKGHFK